MKGQAGCAVTLKLVALLLSEMASHGLYMGCTYVGDVRRHVHPMIEAHDLHVVNKLPPVIDY